MELFRTVVKCTGSPEKIGYGTPFLMLGSCFAENIGVRLQQLKFNINLNPFGIVYHPVPVAQCIDRMVSGAPYVMEDLQQHNGLWYSFDHHGRFSHPDAEVCLQQINTSLQQAHEHLSKSEWLFITFGTAWAYRLKNNGRVVANCHKYPASDFERIRSGVDELHAIWMETITKLRRFNPTIKIVFTISPVRHLRDGAHENQLSKAILLLAVDRINRDVANTAYFPAYEIVLDDLRDYRFYNDDMAHPSTLAIDYVWKRFCECYLSKDGQQIMKEVEDIVKASAHRPIHRTPECRRFATGYLEKIVQLQHRLPQLNFTEEIQRFEMMLTA